MGVVCNTYIPHWSAFLANTNLVSGKSVFPRGPILDWGGFARIKTIEPPSVAELPQRVFTTSGRAALYQALLQLALPTGSRVLVPTYHCPTIVAPVLLAGLAVEFYPVRADALPDLKTIDVRKNGKYGAIIVPHYFGLPKSLAEVRDWCDERGVALIEDCAHCLFGFAGDRAVGTWGDFATASLSKFLPVPEAGLLASVRRKIIPLDLDRRALIEQFKGVVDVLEISGMNKGLRPFDFPINLCLRLKNARQQATLSASVTNSVPLSDDMIRLCDMGRIRLKPLWVSRILSATVSKGSNIDQRRKNFLTYLDAFRESKRAYPLFLSLPNNVVPYVFPLWVDDPDRAYGAIRAKQLPVLRWDRLWPGTPQLTGDFGGNWSRHLLQLLCHQSLSTPDITLISDEINSLL